MNKKSQRWHCLGNVRTVPFPSPRSLLRTFPGNYQTNSANSSCPNLSSIEKGFSTAWIKEKMVPALSATGQVACWYPSPRLAFPVPSKQPPSHTGLRGCWKALLGLHRRSCSLNFLSRLKTVTPTPILRNKPMSRTTLSVKICFNKYTS